MNSITIGRNPQNNVVVDSRFATVSGQHATIENVGGQLYLQDHSTNGTYVNGQYVHNNRVPINATDTITLGREYHVDLTSVQRILGGNINPDSGRNTARCQGAAQPQQPFSPQQININIGGQSKPEPQYVEPTPERPEPNNLNKFNFGAFYFNWIWGLANGVYWALCCFIPIVGFIVAIVLGVKANREAWETFKGTAKEFEERQAAWSKWAWILFALSFIAGIIIGISES